MRTLGHILLGILLGIILFVIAIGGAVYAIGTLPVGDVLGTFNVQVIPPDHVLYNQSLIDIVKGVMNDVQNLNTLTIRDLKDKYGLPLPDEIGQVEGEGISLAPLYDATIGELTSGNIDPILQNLIDGIKLENILILATGSTDQLNQYPIFADNLKNNIRVTLDNLTGVLNPDTITIRSLYDNFGFKLSNMDPNTNDFEMQLLNELAYLPIPKFADAIQTVNIGTVLDVDADRFINQGENQIYVKVDKYVAIPNEELQEERSNPDYKLNPLSKKYVSDIKINTDGTYEQVKKELRFIQKEVPVTPPTDGAQTTVEGTTPDTTPTEFKYVVDNTSNTDGFDVTTEHPTYYRFIEYEPYDATNTEHKGKDLYVDYVANSFAKESGTNNYTPKIMGKFALKDLYCDETGTLSLQQQIFDNQLSGTVNINNAYYQAIEIVEGTEQTSFNAAPSYGYKAPTTEEHSRLEENLDGEGISKFLRVYQGAADMAIQHLSGLTISGLSNPQDSIMSLKLSDIIEISPDNILSSLADCKIGDIPNEIEKLEIQDIIKDITFGEYTQNPEGHYVKIIKDNGSFYYTVYNAETHNALDPSLRYDYCDYVESTVENNPDNTKTLYYKNIDGEFVDDASASVDGKKYIKADIKLLQRIATENIKSISSLLDTIVLGDIMDIKEEDVLYAFSDKTINQIPDSVNTLKVNQVIKDIKFGIYKPNPEGQYVKINDPDGTYYTVYDEEKHSKLNPLERFDYLPYTQATEKQIKDESITKYYRDKDDNFSTVESSSVDGIKYVQSDNRLLQRIANTNIKGISSLMNEIVIGDVMEINEDNILFAFAGKTINEIPAAVDTLKINQVIKNITFGEYTQNNEGHYKKVTNADGSFYYTVYDEDKDKSLDPSLRYDYCDYVESTVENNPNNEKTLYYKKNDGSFTQNKDEDGVADKLTTYIKADSRLIQRIANEQINDIANLMNTMVIGDVMDIHEDNILYVFSGKTINEIPAAVDTLTVDQIIKDITYGNYVQDNNGCYIKIINADKSSYYTVYNPAKHATLPVEQRANYIDYVVANKKQLADDSKQKYYFVDGQYVTEKPTSYTGDIYVKADSKILQRIASSNVKGMGTLMNTLVLGDVINIDLNAFAPVVEGEDVSGLELYYFDSKNNMYKHAYSEGGVYKNSLGEEITNAITDTQTIYKVTKEGTSHTLIKNLATVQVNDMGTAFSSIMDDLMFTDLLDVNTSAIVSTTDTSKPAKYFVEENKKYPGYTFVKNEKGLYTLEDHDFIKITEDQKATLLKSSTSKNYKWQQLTPEYIEASTTAEVNAFVAQYNKEHGTSIVPAEILAAKTQEIAKKFIESLNLYVKSPTEEIYTYNTSLALYLYSSTAENKARCFLKVNGAGNTYTPYESNSLLYVETSIGKLIPYDINEPSHMDLPMYFKITDGYYPVNEQSATFVFKNNVISNKDNSTTGNGYIYLNNDEVLGNYYHNIQHSFDKPLTSEKYSKKAVYSIVKDNSKVYGYLADVTQKAEEDKVYVVEDISVPLLRGLANKNKPITKLNDVIKDFKLNELMEIEPDSLLDLPAFKNIGIDQLSTAFAQLFNDMTIGSMATALNINFTDPKVLGMVKDITFKKLMESLKVDPSTHALGFDMEKLLA